MSLCRMSLGICTREGCRHFHPDEDQIKEAIMQQAAKGTDRVCKRFPNCRDKNCPYIHIYGKMFIPHTPSPRRFSISSVSSIPSVSSVSSGANWRRTTENKTTERTKTTETTTVTMYKGTKDTRDFAPDELKKMLERLQDKELRAQVEYCMYNLRRFAKDAMDGEEFKTAHFAYNLGRVQEILQPAKTCGTAGAECWWHRFEPLLKGPYADLSNLAREVSKKLGLID